MAGIVAAKSCGDRAYENILQASLCVMLGAGESCLQPRLIMERAKRIANATEGLHCVL